MKNELGLSFRPKTCLRCGGDAYLSMDDGDWRCLQCGRPVAIGLAAIKTATDKAQPASSGMQSRAA